jgi:hypothetical protein
MCTSDMTEDDAQRSWHFQQLRQSLHALANAASNQPALFPDSVASADDLAFGYDHWSTLVRGAYGSELTRPQTDALDAIDRKIATMSSDGTEFDVDVWTDAALSTSAHWLDLRQLAAVALEVFGWSET